MDGEEREEKNPGEEAEEEGNVKETRVVKNAPKKVKTSEANKNKPPVPGGFVRCNECGGWGKDLVKENGMYCIEVNE